MSSEGSHYEELWSRDHLRYRGKCPLLESKFSAFVVEGNYFQYVFARKWVSVCNVNPPSLLAQFLLFSRSVWQKSCLIIGFHTKLRDWQHPPPAIGEILDPPLVKAQVIRTLCFIHVGLLYLLPPGNEVMFSQARDSHSVYRAVWCHFLSGCLVPCSFHEGSLPRG